MGRRLGRLTTDISPLRISRDFRLLWSGSFVSSLGSQFAKVGLYIQAYALTGSPAHVGWRGVSGLIGGVAGVLVGGAFIATHDPRPRRVWPAARRLAPFRVRVAGA